MVAINEGREWEAARRIKRINDEVLDVFIKHAVSPEEALMVFGSLLKAMAVDMIAANIASEERENSEG